MPKQSNETQSMNQVGGQGGGQDKEVAARAYDHEAAQERMAKLREKQKLQKEAERTRENEIAKIEVPEADVLELADAMNCTPAVASRRLKERNGDFMQILRDALHGKYAQKA